MPILPLGLGSIANNYFRYAKFNVQIFSIPYMKTDGTVANSRDEQRGK